MIKEFAIDAVALVAISMFLGMVLVWASILGVGL
jgi:hypothetical protein